MRILITGSNGLLGQKIVRQCLKNGHEFLATSKGENRNPDCPESFFKSMDIVDSHEIETIIADYRPSHVIHTAAITNVDHCELNPEECRIVNTTAVGYLYEVCKKYNVHFQLLSTDFVFDGAKGNYKETDEVGPLSVYASSKVEAERILKNDPNGNWSIVRTIIVYGKGNNLSRSNIVLWAKDALKAGQSLTIVDDQFRAPTWADDLAWACLEICRRNKKGVFHICGPETMSIYDLVCRIAAHYGLSAATVTPSSSETLNQPAKRPPRTGFDLTHSRTELGYDPKTIEETLDLI